MSATAIKLVIKFWHDDAPDDPCNMDGWKAYSFSHRHANFALRGSFHKDRLRELTEQGLAFPLSYFEHGQCLWTLVGELPPGARCRFDSSSFAGYLIWEGAEDDLGPKTVEERRADARAFIERFTYWCNGEIYGYTIEAVAPCPTCKRDEEAEVDFDLPSCGGYYPDDIEYMVECMKEHIGDGWRDYEVEFKEQHGYGLAEKVKGLWKEEA